MLLRLPPRLCERNRENPFFGSGVRKARKHFQARIWLGWVIVNKQGQKTVTGGNVNLGLYETPEAAKSVLRDVSRHVPADAWTPLEVWRTAVSRAGSFSGDASEVLASLLPMWVHKSFDGRSLMAKVRSKDRLYVMGGFQCPEAAHKDALRVWQQIYGKMEPCVWKRKAVLMATAGANSDG